MTLNDEWEDLLDSVDEYLDDHEDVVDGDYGEPRPNRAMSLRQRLVGLRERKARASARDRAEHDTADPDDADDVNQDGRP